MIVSDPPGIDLESPPLTRLVPVAARDGAAVALLRAAVCTVLARHLGTGELPVRLPVHGRSTARVVPLTGTLRDVAELLQAPAAPGGTGPADAGGVAVAFLDGSEPGRPEPGAPLTVRTDRTDGEQVLVHAWPHPTARSSTAPAAVLRQAEQVLRAATADPTRPAGTLPLLDDEEGRLLLVERNDTSRALAHAGTLHGEFLATARRQPEAVAVLEAPGTRHTFGALAGRIHGRAVQLAALGVAPGSRVAVHLRQSAELLVSCLAANAAGAAFVPLDPAFPAERRRGMLAAAGCDLLVTSAELLADAEDVAPDGLPVLVVGGPGDQHRTASATPTPGGPDDLCYVMFTSGSTGAPKGIALRHRGVLNNLTDLRDRFGIGRGDAVLTLSSPAFDMSVVELLGVPLAGGTAVVPEPGRAGSPLHWADLVGSAGVTVWNSVPALAELFVHRLERAGRTAPGLRLAMLGGDWVPLDLPGRLRGRSPGMDVIALGGATEASVHSTVYQVRDVDPGWASIPYGRPMTNQRVYVLDAARQPVPTGVPGELHLAGAGLAEGYVGDVDGDRFFRWQHPLVGTERLYRTGDLVVWRPDGELEILGRVDLQLKIHGVRLEARFIETAICRHPGVREAAVVVTGAQEHERRLAAFVVPGAAAPPTAQELRDFLAGSLAAREIPSVFVLVPELPLNPSGKVDRRALAARTVAADSEPGSARTGGPGAGGDAADDGIRAAQDRVALVWSAALGFDVVDPGSNFFLIGGDSFTALMVVDEIDPELSLQELFTHPTVAGLARRLVELGLAGT